MIEFLDLVSSIMGSAGRWISHPHVRVRVVIVVGAVVAVLLWDRYKGKSSERFWNKAGRLDAFYGFLHFTPVSAILIATPVTRVLDAFVDRFVPFLRLNLMQDASPVVHGVVAALVYDLLYYGMHRWSHRNRYLWAFHAVHHSPTRLVPYTSWRLHIVDVIYVDFAIFFGQLILGRFTMWAWLPLAVILFAVVMVEHSETNWSYGPLDKILVSPRIHAIHHSAEPQHHDRNFGMMFSFWDRLFGTAASSDAPPRKYGLEHDDVPLSFLGQMVYPFRKIIGFWRPAPTGALDTVRG
jgi:sterol desaturase/sphingolipid hydroxylase (fatty acid hydroxylase superfamily)